MSKRIIKGITYITAKNLQNIKGTICDCCDLHSDEYGCKIDSISNEPNCRLHFTEVYKISLKYKFKKL